MIPYGVIAFGAYWSMVAWLLFARAFKRPSLYWLCIPFFVLGSVYTWFSLVDVPLELRAVWVRNSLMMVLFTQAPILTFISLAWMWFKKGHGDD